MQAHIWQFSRCAVIALFCAITQFASAQTTTVPGNKTEPRKLPDNITKGGVSNTGASTGASIVSRPSQSKPIVQQIIYIVISEARQWTSTDGKTLMGKLIAWEETVTTGPAPQSATAPPVTTRPTVLKNNQVRLLIDHKAYPVPLERLDPDARKFIGELQAHLVAKP